MVACRKDQRIEVNNDESHSVGNNRTKTIAKDETISIGQNQTTTIDKNCTRIVNATDTVAVKMDKNTSVGTTYHISAKQEITLVCGETSLTMNSDGLLTIKCKNFNITAVDNGQIKTESGKLDLNM